MKFSDKCVGVYRHPSSADMDMDIIPMSLTVCHNNGAFYDVTNTEPCTASNLYSALQEPEPAACGKGKAGESFYDLAANMDDCHGNVLTNGDVKCTT